jgi:predicted ArsR family transcriptional regulator
VEPVGIFGKQNDKSTTVKQLKAMLKMRPVTVIDIASATGISESNVRKFLKDINAKEQIYNGEVYYSL